VEIGNIVTRKDGQYLRSGGAVYSTAIVVQVSPLVLVSPGTDMRWESTVQDVEFSVIGQATSDQLERCQSRL